MTPDREPAIEASARTRQLDLPPSVDGDATPRTASTGRLRTTVWLAGVLGLALAIGLLVRSGLPSILALLRVAGWRLLWLAPIHVIPLALDAAGWRLVIPPEPKSSDAKPSAVRPRGGRPSYARLTGIAIVREAVGTLLPVRVGGELAGIRLLMRSGLSGITASASVVVEVTLWLLAQVLFAVLGLLLLIRTPHAGAVPRYGAVGLLIAACVVAAFMLVQRRVGLFGMLEHLLARIAGRGMMRTLEDSVRLDGAIRVLYQNRRAITVCTAWQCSAFVAGAGETWITLHLLGRPIGFGPAIILESLSMAVQSAAFILPAGLGAQEASLVVLGTVIGVSTSTALALSMARRVRQLTLGLPGLLAWLWVERSRPPQGWIARSQTTSGRDDR